MKMRIITAAYLTALTLLFPNYVFASYKEECRIKYENSGKVYDGACTYATGSELSQSTGNYGYGFANYAVFFWAQGQASIIKLNGIYICGMQANEGCMNSIMPISGTDQDGRNWKVCQPNHMFC